MVTFGTLFPFSVISALTFSSWSSYEVMEQPIAFWVEYVPNQVMLPVGGLLIATLVAWRMPLRISEDELNFTNGQWFWVWSRLMRFVVVPAVFIILLTGL